MIYKDKQKTRTQVCIVGTGLGGGSLAIKLAEKGIDFILVEAGDIDRDSNNVLLDNSGREFGLRTTRSIQLGGTSNLWHGVLSPLDKIDFEERSWIPGSGWPIKLDDLIPYYKESARIFNIVNYEYFDVSKLPYDLSSKLYNIKFNRDYLKNKIFQQPLPVKCLKYDLLDIVDKSDSFHLYLNTTALHLELDVNDSVAALKVGSENGDVFNICADVYVIAAGALESPRLLLNSKINNSNVGKYLMDHPMANVCQLKTKEKQKAHLYQAIKYIPSVAIKTGLVLFDKFQSKYNLPNHAFYIRASFTKGIDNEVEKIKLALLTFKDRKAKLKDFWKVITNINVILQVALYKFSLNPRFRYSDLFFVTEQVPNIDSNVTLSDTKDSWGYPISKVNWVVSDLDMKYMKDWGSMLENKFFNSSDYEFTYKFNLEEWNNNFTSAAHHVGTNRMGDNPKNSVVDSNLKVHGYDNLYVCDGSVFTTAGNVNCGFTISALACRLADHIINRKI